VGTNLAGTGTLSIVRSATRFTMAEGPESQSEKTNEFSTLHICVRNRRIDEFWNSQADGLVTIQ
jgi:hypothetical protein